jgi:TATA-box binding protein (TBP) (component of TFIID and TFIIIB)
LLSLATKELYGLTAGPLVHQYSGSTGKVICLGADSNHDSVMLVKESTKLLQKKKWM